MRNNRLLWHKLTIITFSILLSVGVFLTITADNISAQTDDFKPAISNGAVSVAGALVQPDGKILVAGDFNSINTSPINGIARFNPDGTLDASFNTGSGADGAVNSIALQADGKIIIAGTFNAYDGVDVGRIARLNADGSIDTTFNSGGSGANNSIFKAKVSANGKILIGGSFATYNGTARVRFARLNSDGTLDTAFDPGSGVSSSVFDIAVQADGKYLIGGAFTTYNGTPASRIARINTDGSLDTSFMIGTGPNTTVRTVTLQSDGKILITGTFATIDGNARPGIARFNADGSIDTGFAAAPTGTTPQSLVLQPNGKIIVAGNFTSIGGASRNVIARLNADGTNDASFDPGTGILPVALNNVQELALQANGKILMVGTINSYNGNSILGIARANSDGSFDSTFDQYATRSGNVNAIQIQSDGKILVGGEFATVNRILRNSIARFNADGTVDSTFMPGTGATISSGAFANVTAIRVQSDGKIIIGGSFVNYNETPINRLARLNADGSLDTTFNIGAGAASTVNAVQIQPDGKILVGGIFTSFNGMPANRLVRLNTDGTLDTTFNIGTGVGGAVNVITLQSDGKIYLGGTFTSYNGTASNRIVRINADGTLDASFNIGSGTTGTVSAIVIQPDGKVILGGAFSSYNGTNLSRIVRLNTNGSIDPSFNISNVLNSNINEVLLLPNGKILIAGAFQTINGLPRKRIARLNSDGGFDASFITGNGTNDTINVLKRQPDGKILVGGAFESFQDRARSGIARITLTGSSFADFDGDGKTDLSVFRPTEGSWFIQQSTSGFTGLKFGISNDKLTPVDFDGDGKTDVAVWRENSNNPGFSYFYILNSGDNTFRSEQFGAPGDDPSIVGDFDGDGKADPAVYRNAVGAQQSAFYYRPSSQPGVNFNTILWGANGDKPMRGDFDGDGKQDAAVFRPSNNTWYVLQSSNNQPRYDLWGAASDKFVNADYDGDGKTDLAVFRDGTWDIKQSSDNQPRYEVFGLAADKLVPADYDGDGKADVAVFRNGTWYILQSSNVNLNAQLFGADTDTPMPSAFVVQ